MIQLQLQQELIKLISEQAALHDLFGQRKKGEKRTFDLADSKFWYLTTEQAEAYISSYGDSNYATKMQGPEYELLKNNSKKIINLLSDSFTFLSFGPGLEVNGKLLMNESILREKTPNYVGIDISPIILDATKKTLSTFEIEKNFFVGDFENREHLDLVNRQVPNNQKFVYLGATLSNYDTDMMLNFLRDTLSGDDLVYVSMQEKPSDIQALVDQYEDIVKSDMFDGVNQLGFDRSMIKPRYNESNSCMEAYVRVDTVPSLLEGLVSKWDELVFFTSKKPTKEYFQEKVSQYFKGEYFFENGFMGFVGKKNEEEMKK